MEAKFMVYKNINNIFVQNQFNKNYLYSIVLGLELTYKNTRIILLVALYFFYNALVTCYNNAKSLLLKMR